MFVKVIISVMVFIVFAIACWIITVDICDRKRMNNGTDGSDCGVTWADLDTIHEWIQDSNRDFVFLAERVADLEAAVDILVLDAEDIYDKISDDTE